jgi:hypothetical protein
MQAQCDGRIDAAVKQTRLEMTAQLNQVIESNAADISELNARLLSKIRSVEELTGAVAAWQAKYDADMAELQRYARAIRGGGVLFLASVMKACAKRTGAAARRREPT